LIVTAGANGGAAEFPNPSQRRLFTWTDGVDSLYEPNEEDDCADP
jgi:hypothetical protein